MITARFFATGSDQYTGFSGFEVSGHAGCDVHGRDIVCAAVSVLTQAAVLGLEEVVQCPLKVEVDGGHLACHVECSRDVPLATWRETQVVLEMTYLALKDISKQYPDRVSLIKVGGE